jgi:hypothetical protein
MTIEWDDVLALVELAARQDLDAAHLVGDIKLIGQKQGRLLGRKERGAKASEAITGHLAVAKSGHEKSPDGSRTIGTKGHHAS